MKSVGEVMAIGRTFKEALQKGIRSLEIARFGLGADGKDLPELPRDELRARLQVPNSNRLYSFLRHTANEAILVVVNLNPNPVKADDYSLELAEGPLSGGVTAVTLFGSPVETNPKINAAGGFSNYHPLAEIPGQSATIIQLQPDN